MPLALSDLGWQAVIAAMGVIAIVLALLSIRKSVERGTTNAASAAHDAAAKVDKVSTSLTSVSQLTSQQLDNLSRVAKATHELVNGSMTAQLRMNAIISRRLSDITQLPIDIEAADIAENTYREHKPITVPPVDSE